MDSSKMIRVLCLHSHVSNSKVFEAETAALRHELGKGYEWALVGGSIPTSMESALKGYYPEDDDCFSFVDLHDRWSVAKALQGLNDSILMEGPSDIIMAASAGASVASLLLMREAGHPMSDQPLIKGAVFLSGHAIDASALGDNHLKFLESSLGKYQITIPMENIWRGDDSNPRHTTSSQLAAICKPELNINFIHNADTFIIPC